MAALTTTLPTLFDVVQHTDATGAIPKVVELLTQENEILMDMVWKEGNLATGHTFKVRDTVSGGAFRRFNEGTTPTVQSVGTVTETCAMYTAFSEVDSALARLNGNSLEFMASQEAGKLGAINNDIAYQLFYGSIATDPKTFDGLAIRTNALSGVNNSANVITGGGAGSDNRSIYLVGWGPETVYGIYPKGSVGGLKRDFRGEQVVDMGSGTRMMAYQTYYEWQMGLAVQDWRYLVRIPNIDYSLLKADASTGAILPELMFEALERLPNLSGIRPAFYMPRRVLTIFRQQLAHYTKQSTLEYVNVGGHRVAQWNGINLCRTDALAADEAVVS